MSINFDNDGLIYTNELDGTKGYGDCLANVGRYWHLVFMRDFIGLTTEEPYDFRSAAYLLIVPGRRSLLRAPRWLIPDTWPDPEIDVPGDQQDPFVMAMGLVQDSYFTDVIKSIRQNQNGRYQNGNLYRIDTANIFHRALGEEPSNFRDLGLIGTALTRCGYFPFWDSASKKLKWNDPDDVSDDVNFIHHILAAEIRGATKNSRRAKALYLAQRPSTYGTTKLGYKNKAFGAYAWFYREQNQGIAELARPLIEKVFS